MIFKCLMLFLMNAQAYIPSADFILSKAAKNTGQGFYQIKNELQFPLSDKTIILTETWWTSGSDSLFLKTEGLLFTQYTLYKNGKKFFFTPQGQVASAPMPPHFIESLFFQKNSQEFKNFLIQKKIIPSTIFKKRPIFKNDVELAKWSEPYLKLSRYKGAVTYLLGFASQDSATPGIWIEQDRFAIRKIKLSSDTEVAIESTSDLSKNLIYPKTRIYNWLNKSVISELTRSESLKSGPTYLSETEFSKLANQNKEIPQEYRGTIIEEFYKRFR